MILSLINRKCGISEQRIDECTETQNKLSLFVSAFEQTADAICIADERGRIQYVNQAFADMSGYSKAELIGNSLSMVKSGKQNEEYYHRMWSSILSGNTFRGVMVNKNRYGKLYHIDQTITPIKGNEGNITHFISVCKDVTAQSEESHRIYHQAFHDPLTDLPNRALIYDRLDTALKNAKRQDRRLAVMFVDVDKFKPVNDRYGHAAGDEILKSVAEMLRSSIRESDTAGRLGGDEFVVILENNEDRNGAKKVAEGMLGKTGLPRSYNFGNHKTSISIGIAMFPENGTDADKLLRHADFAMQDVKNNGGNGFQFYSDKNSLQDIFGDLQTLIDN
jgi:diguanylate cyclase (GGDEF)-like protein/PAS domain S-box-containing protein